MNIPKRIWALLDRRQRRHLIGLQLISILMALSTVGGIAAVVPFFAALADPNAIRGNALLRLGYQRLHFHSETAYVIALGLSFAVLVLLANTVNLLGTLAINRFASQVGNTLYVRLFEEYLRRDYGFHSQTNSSALASKVLYETGRVSTGILQQGLIFISTLVTIVFVVISMLLLNPLVAASATLGLGASYAVIYAVTRRRLLRNGQNESRHFAARMQLLNETFGAIKEMTILDARDLFIQRFAQQCRSIARTELNTLAISLSPRNVLECLTAFFLVGGALYLRSRSDGVGPWLTQLSFIGLAAYRMLPALQQAFVAVVRVRANLPALDHIAGDLDNASRGASPAAPPAAELPGRGWPHRQIRLHDVSFAYAPGRPAAISSLSLEIRAGASVGFIGSNGSGKTTLVDLLAGLLVPQSGYIEVDGIKLDQQLTRRAWQANIAYVPQHVCLLDATLAENIALGVPPPRIDRDRLDLAVQLARLTECVSSLPHGYDEKLGEHGSRLSGGQRQRLGIARALYRDASLLILDEATSALDPEAEQEIIDMLEALPPGRTLILITHRLAALRHCKCIYELKDGRIVRGGSYHDLQLPPRARLLRAQ